MQLGSIEGNVITIKGSIKTVGDYSELKSYLQKLVDSGVQEITLNITDSYTITSAVVGYLFKIININKIKIKLNVKDERLYKILEELKLTEIFNVTKLH